MVVFLPFPLCYASDSEGNAVPRSQVSKADTFPVHLGARDTKHFWVLLGPSCKQDEKAGDSYEIPRGCRGGS